MRAFLIFMGLVVSLCAAFTTFILLGRDAAHENQMAGAAGFVEQQIAASVTGDRRAKPIHIDSVEPQSEPGVWAVTGRVAIEDGSGPTIEGTYIGIIKSTCEAYDESRCWQLHTLTLGDLELPSAVAGPADRVEPAGLVTEAPLPRAEDARSRITKALAAISSEPLPAVPADGQSAASLAQERDSLLRIVHDLNDLLGGLEEKVATLESETAVLGEKIQAVTWERDRLSENLSALDLERGGLSEKSGDGNDADLEAIVRQLQAQLTAANENIEGLAAELSTVGGERQALTKKLMAVAAERDALAEQSANLSAESDDLSPKVAGLTAEREALTTWVSQLTAEREALTAQIAELSAQGAALSSQVAELTADRDGLAPKVSELTAERDGLSARIGEMNTEIEGFSSWVERLTGESESLSARLSELMAERKALSSQVATLSTKTETLSTQVSQLTTERDQLTTQLMAVTGERDQFASQAQSLAGEAKTLSISVSDLAAERDALSARVAALTEEREQLSSRVTALVGEREAAASKLSAMASKHDVVLKQVTTLATEREALMTKAALATEQPAETSPDKGELSARVAALTVERDALSSRAENLSSQVESLARQRDALSTTVAEMTTQRRIVPSEPAEPDPAVAGPAPEGDPRIVRIADLNGTATDLPAPVEEPVAQGGSDIAPKQVNGAPAQAVPIAVPEAGAAEVETAAVPTSPEPATAPGPAPGIDTADFAKRLQELSKQIDISELESWLDENLSKLPATTKQDNGRRLPTDPAVVVANRDLILQYQRQLTHAGFNPGPIDGLYGPRTGKALRSYQLAVGLPPNGGFDSPTLQALSRQRPAPNGSGTATGGVAEIKLARAVYVAPEELNRQNYKGLIAVLVGLLAVSFWFTGWRALFSRRSG